MDEGDRVLPSLLRAESLRAGPTDLAWPLPGQTQQPLTCSGWRCGWRGSPAPTPSFLCSPDGRFSAAWSSIICEWLVWVLLEGNKSHLPEPFLRSFQKAFWAKSQKRKWHMCAAPTRLPSPSLWVCCVPAPGTAHPGPVTGCEKPPLVTPQLSRSLVKYKYVSGRALLSLLSIGPRGAMVHMSPIRDPF